MGAEGLGRAALPIEGSRERDRLCRDLRRIREVTRRRCRVLEEPEGDPTGVELGLNPPLDRFRRIIAHDRVCCIGIASVEELARDETALNPPLVTVGQPKRAGRRGGEDFRALIHLVLLAQELNPGEEVRLFRVQGGRHGVECLLGIALLLSDRDTCLREEDVILAGVSRRAESRGPALLQQKALHTITMVGLGQDPWEQIQDFGL